jgi:alpha-1,3-rhamnosyl/mannosyltransferase
LRVAFNATALLSPLTGVGQYTLQMARALAADPQIDVEFFYGAAWSRNVAGAPLPGAGKVLPWLRKHLPYSYEIRRLVQSARFGRHAALGRFDLYHEPNFLPLPFAGPLVLTVHDLSWIRYPQAHPPERVQAMERYFEPGLRRADLVIAVSQFVRGEIIERFGLEPARVRAIGEGADALFTPQDAVATGPTLQRLGLQHGHYFLSVGTLEPRKNLQRVLDAYAGLPDSLRAACPLVLAGMAGWDTAQTHARIAQLVAAGEIRRLGYLPRADLAMVTAGARVLVYPSLYEGFGLPPLEAMSCGVPVITSNVSSLPEVVGDAGVLVTPTDTAQIQDAMERMAVEDGFREEMAARALVRSRDFSWGRCAQETVAAYREVVAGR